MTRPPLHALLLPALLALSACASSHGTGEAFTDEAACMLAFSARAAKQKAGADAPTAAGRDEFGRLRGTFARAAPLIRSAADRERLSLAMESIAALSETPPRSFAETAAETAAEYAAPNGQARLVARFERGAYRGALGHTVSAAFYLEDGGGGVRFFLTDDDTDLCIDIGGGGERGEAYAEQGGDELRGDKPNRFYEFDTRAGRAEFRDFYWY